jgi:hypothetical protein
MEKDGTDEHAMLVEMGKRKASQREFAACDKLLEYDIKMHNLVVDMRSVDQANNAYVGSEVEQGMGELAAYLENARKNVPRRGG